MKKQVRNILVSLSALAMLASCGGGGNGAIFEIKNNPYIPDTYEGKDTYNALLATPLKSLNTATTMSAENSQHIANFVDGLVENDSFGRLKKALATSVKSNKVGDEYTFTIRKNIPWLTSTGEQYVANVQGRKVKQEVTAHDFVFGVKSSLDFRNYSDCYYLPAMFVKNGYKYWAYTVALDYKARYEEDRNPMYNVNAGWDTDAGMAEGATRFGSMLSGTDIVVTEDEIKGLSDFSSVGVRAKDDHTAVYTLEDPAPYFVSALTYTPFLPINENFIKEIGFDAYGEGNDTFLYNGAYYLSLWDEKNIVYKRNPEYWDKENVHLNTITYNIISTGDLPDDYVRKQFEDGKVDAFGISNTDTNGWNTYITGPDGTGTIEEPYSGDVYSREIDTVDSTFYLTLNMKHKKGDGSELSQKDIDNANNAMSLQAVRKLLTNGLDYQMYNRRYGLAAGYENQYQMWTYIPKKFVEDDSGKDYAEYYYEAYEEKYGLEKGKAAEILKQGSIAHQNFVDGVEYDSFEAKMKALAEDAKKAVELAKAKGINISFPIKFEYLGLNWDAKESGYDAEWIERFNEAANGCTTNLKHETDDLPWVKNYPYFEIVQNKRVSEDTYTDWGQQGYFHLYVVGWGPDYADPLTYLNTMVKGGDMGRYNGTNTTDAVDNYVMNNDKTDLVKSDLLEHYSDTVASGKEIVDNVPSRYSYFAQAELELLTELCIMKPLYMNGQGWSITVSKLAGYETPTASYGLSSYKLKGIYSLTTVMGGADRKAAKAKYEADKAKALQDKSYTIYD